MSIEKEILNKIDFLLGEVNYYSTRNDNLKNSYIIKNLAEAYKAIKEGKSQNVLDND